MATRAFSMQSCRQVWYHCLAGYVVCVCVCVCVSVQNLSQSHNFTVRLAEHLASPNYNVRLKLPEKEVRLSTTYTCVWQYHRYMTLYLLPFTLSLFKALHATSPPPPPATGGLPSRCDRRHARCSRGQAALLPGGHAAARRQHPQPTACLQRDLQQVSARVTC